MAARSAAHAARLPRSRRGRRRGKAAPRSRTRRATRSRTGGARSAGSGVRTWIRRLIAVGALVGVLVAAYMLWFRDSSLVEVRDVSVVGISSADRDEVSAALTQAARGMTTLHVREDELRAVVQPYPTVKSVSADPSLPNGLTIEVAERKPVGVIDLNGRDLPVAGDGTLLPGISTSGLDLPALEADADPSATRLSEGPLEQSRLLGTAPDPIRPLIERSFEDEQGVEVELTDGIVLRFGDATQANAKWAAAARILADDELASLTYIDLSAPQRPAVGGAATAPGAT
jgi:cell division protein FtsQ